MKTGMCERAIIICHGCGCSHKLHYNGKAINALVYLPNAGMEIGEDFDPTRPKPLNYKCMVCKTNLLTTGECSGTLIKCPTCLGSHKLSYSRKAVTISVHLAL